MKPGENVIVCLPREGELKVTPTQIATLAVGHHPTRSEHGKQSQVLGAEPIHCKPGPRNLVEKKQEIGLET